MTFAWMAALEHLSRKDTKALNLGSRKVAISKAGWGPSCVFFHPCVIQFFAIGRPAMMFKIFDKISC